MTLPESVTAGLRAHVGAVQHAVSVGGGCIANATRIDTEQGRFFLKWSGGDAGLTFEAEAAGLRALRAADSPLVIPEVIAAQNAGGPEPGFLLMDWVEPGAKGDGFWQRFGEGLAVLHRHAAKDRRYGFEVDNFIGRIEQANAWAERWPDFFRSQRLEPQIALARKTGRWRTAWDEPAGRLLDRLDDLLPASPPASVLHGDLWSGNVLAAADGCAALIDPATYVGHREADLAMTELFGGFGRRFYDACRAAWPLEPGYPERREVYNLYHLVNHLNHFGAGYAAGVEGTLRRFG
ncbi:MAG: fructosamine kinase family protein [Bacteroidota bacterium]